MASFRSSSKKNKMAMPRMHSSSTQCCLCSIGVFMFLGGIIMIATGASLILNYGIVDEDLLLPELRNDNGKKIVGIILICVGLVLTVVSFTVSLYYLCIHPNKKPSNVKPDELRNIPNGSVTSSARQSSSQRPGSKDSVRSNLSTGQSAKRKVSPAEGPARLKEKPSASSQFSQSVPNVHHRSKQKVKSSNKKKPKRLIPKTQLEDIKELDTISRKTVEVDYTYMENMEEIPRSQSEMDAASLTNASDHSSRVPVFYISDHTHSENSLLSRNEYSEHSLTTINDNRGVFISSDENLLPGTISSEYNTQDDSDDQVLSIDKNKQTKYHSSHDNPTVDGDNELISTGSESTVTRNLLTDDQSQTSSL